MVCRRILAVQKKIQADSPSDLPAEKWLELNSPE